VAVAVIATDTWLSHLEFTGGRRQTDFGPIDGVFYGVISGDGDASAGNFTLNGNVSFDRKEDWIYILKKFSLTRNDLPAGQVAFAVAATGPVIPTGSTVTNPSFHVGGTLFEVTGNAVSVFDVNTGGGKQFEDIPIFGDKRLPGPLSMIAAGFQTNDNTVTYQLSVYGWLIKYQSFFRNLVPSTG